MNLGNVSLVRSHEISPPRDPLRSTAGHRFLFRRARAETLEQQTENRKRAGERVADLRRSPLAIAALIAGGISLESAISQTAAELEAPIATVARYGSARDRARNAVRFKAQVFRILELKARGSSTPEIAQKLGICRRTVERAVSAVFGPRRFPTTAQERKVGGCPVPGWHPCPRRACRIRHFRQSPSREAIFALRIGRW